MSNPIERHQHQDDKSKRQSIGHWRSDVTLIVVLSAFGLVLIHLTSRLHSAGQLCLLLRRQKSLRGFLWRSLCFWLDDRPKIGMVWCCAW